ncbi:TPA: universal stress protein [Candidatus Bathyarchaeota archaeon]|nr:universal stress protein [Candidatus Bathyarchaeota archaeon]
MKETIKNAISPKVPSIHISKILVPIDGSKLSMKALKLAINFAIRYKSKICLVNVIPTYQLCHWLTVSGGIFCSDTIFVPSVIMREMEKESRSLLISALTLVQSIGIESYAMMGKGYPANEIIRIAKEENVGLIVIGSNNSNIFVRLLFGSISHTVARKAPCPILIVKRDETHGDNK